MVTPGMECHSDIYMDGSISKHDTVKIVSDDFRAAAAYRSRLSKENMKVRTVLTVLRYGKCQRG